MWKGNWIWWIEKYIVQKDGLRVTSFWNDPKRSLVMWCVIEARCVLTFSCFVGSEFVQSSHQMTIQSSLFKIIKWGKSNLSQKNRSKSWKKLCHRIAAPKMTKKANEKEIASSESNHLTCWTSESMNIFIKIHKWISMVWKHCMDKR